MAKITIFLLTTCAFGYLICTESPTAEPEKSESSTESRDVEDESLDKRGINAQAVFGSYQQYGRPYQSPVLSECHVCTDCPKIDEDAPSKLCPYSSDPNKRGKCVTYAEKYRHMQRPWYIRGCVSERGSCEDIRKAHQNHHLVSLQFCQECDGEKCNRSGASTFADCTIAFITLVVTPFISKLTLS